MKRIVISGTLFLFVMLLTQADVFGQAQQRGRFGATPEDSVRCTRNLVMYQDRHRQENFEAAYPFWQEVYNTCPQATRNIFTHGEQILGHMVQNAEGEEEKQKYLEEAMEMFDKRIEHYGDEANVLARKGIFWFQHNPNVLEAETGYEALRKSLELSGQNPSAAAIGLLMNVTVGKFQAGIVDNSHVLETYSYLTEVMNNAAGNGNLATVRQQVESLFTASGAADCDALIKLYGERVEQSPDNAELLKDVQELLATTRCTDSDLYLSVTEKLHDIDPTAQTARNLAAMYNARNDSDQVLSYLKQAVDLETNPEERANYLLDIAILYDRTRNDRQTSRQFATQALNDNPRLGRAHLHIGLLYASEQNCFTGDAEEAFKKRTIFWVAVDRFNEAKRVDPSVTAEANRHISTYSPFFPDMETIFFHGLSEGDNYRVECWINETTRVRARR